VTAADPREDLDLDRLTELEQAARELTQHEWEEGDGWVYTLPIYTEHGALAYVLGDRYAVHETAAAEKERAQRNVRLIVALRNHAPDLIAAARERDQLRATVERVRAVLYQGGQDAEGVRLALMGIVPYEGGDR
jgi:hypothetical protein